MSLDNRAGTNDALLRWTAVLDSLTPSSFVRYSAYYLPGKGKATIELFSNISCEGDSLTRDCGVYIPLETLAHGRVKLVMQAKLFGLGILAADTITAWTPLSDDIVIPKPVLRLVEPTDENVKWKCRHSYGDSVLIDSTILSVFAFGEDSAAIRFAYSGIQAAGEILMSDWMRGRTIQVEVQHKNSAQSWRTVREPLEVRATFDDVGDLVRWFPGFQIIQPKYCQNLGSPRLLAGFHSSL